MNLSNLIMLAIGMGLGMVFQRFFHIIQDLPPQSFKTKTKLSLREVTSSRSKTKQLIRHLKKHLKNRSTKSEKASEVEVVSPGATTTVHSLDTSEGFLSSPTNVSMSDISPKSFTGAESSTMATTQNVTVKKIEVFKSISTSSVSTSSLPSSSTLVPENLKTPTPTEFSVHDSDEPKPKLQNPLVTLPSGDAQSSYTTTFSNATSPNFGEMPLHSYTSVSNFNEASMTSTNGGNTGVLRRRNAVVAAPHQLLMHPHRSHIRTSPAITDWSRTLTPPSGRQMNPRRSTVSTLSSAKSIETLPCFENDLSSDPFHTINFKSPFNENVNLTITNVTTNRIMWALKTNAMDRVIATPTCGFLPAGNTVNIKMGIREKSEIHPADSARDRMAIDYAFVPQNCVAFDPARLLSKNSDARRKSFDINYVF